MFILNFKIQVAATTPIYFHSQMMFPWLYIKTNSFSSLNATNYLTVKFNLMCTYAVLVPFPSLDLDPCHFSPRIFALAEQSIFNQNTALNLGVSDFLICPSPSPAPPTAPTQLYLTSPQ